MSIVRVVWKIFRILIMIVLIILLLATSVAVLGELLKDENLLSPWGTAVFTIVSGSMEPNIPVGSLILVTRVEAAQIQIDDIVTYFDQSNTEVVTHRVREISYGEDGYIYTTRGDANNTDDPPLEYDRVIGRVAYTVSGTAFITGVFRDVRYLGMIIIAVGLIITATGVISAAKKSIKRDETDKTDNNDTADINDDKTDASKGDSEKKETNEEGTEDDS